MEKRKKKRKDDPAHPDFDPMSVSSSMDCTGLIPAAPASDEELDSYKDLYEIGGGMESDEE